MKKLIKLGEAVKFLALAIVINIIFINANLNIYS